MIAITGASGNLGKAVLSFLLQKTQAANIVAVVRDPQKLTDFAGTGIQIRKADYNDPESLDTAFRGVEQLLQVSSANYGEQAIREEQNVVAAAVRQGVGHIVYTSTLNPSESPVFWGGQTCVRTEKTIREAGMRYSVFRNSMYMETIPLFIGSAMEDGQIYFSAGNGAISFVSRIDIAEGISNVLLQPEAGNRVYEVTGEKAFTFADVAALLEKNKKISCAYTDVPQEILKEELINAGLPEEEAVFYLNMGDSIKAGEFALVSPQLEKLLGKKRLTAEAYLAQILRNSEVNAG
ncbi:SDR family oxidoreductase [Dyadobacter aurulentus]|uniref:SDR family oxidoreductase n=1 Tax=Dyadobacter sp. UC 10 TaxID=2605428 RepID=UPI0011F18986|nr:SDR family oxidoreductase [Dyadobacter sp. UC 10]KAA0989159.1 SDR family oxidoreductase [Dyadobacter sp. UC 10]